MLPSGLPPVIAMTEPPCHCEERSDAAIPSRRESPLSPTAAKQESQDNTDYTDQAQDYTESNL
jgi:hypothetical protein